MLKLRRTWGPNHLLMPLSTRQGLRQGDEQTPAHVCKPSPVSFLLRVPLIAGSTAARESRSSPCLAALCQGHPTSVCSGGLSFQEPLFFLPVASLVATKKNWPE